MLIVGAGMAGLTAGRELARAGLDVTIIDKGRTVGGRMATRRIGDARFDHGAQHFSARSSAFSAEVDRWLETGVARVWYEGRSITRPERGREARHVGADGMRGIPTELARDLDVRSGTQVHRVQDDAGSLRVETDRGAITGRGCVVTAPIPQLLQLVDFSTDPGLADELAAITYDPCLAVMAQLDGPSELDDGHAASTTGPVAWIADNHHKSISDVPAVTIHSSAAFALQHLDHDPAGWVDALTTAAAPHLTGKATTATGHRWRYSQPRTTRNDGSRGVRGSAPLVLAGEVFAGAKVEGAYLSGVSAAQRVLDRLA
ncbi:MAG: FAD-dependent oxidoreductase [Acidimicrobiia bacterium]|nr:FAD-dependent oxidoreductase [Acidimicrobiia bacterium]